MTWAVTLDSFNGTDIQSSQYLSVFLWDNSPAQGRSVGSVEADIPGLGPQDLRGQPQGTTWRMRVSLTAFDESDLTAAKLLFSPKNGLVYLRVLDGASLGWRVAVRTLRVEQMNAHTLIVTMRVPNPIWETDAVNTSVTGLDMTNVPVASPLVLALTNAGSEDAYPQFLFSPDLNKALTLDDFKYNLSGIIVSRLPGVGPNDGKPVKVPVYLFDSSGAAGRFPTNTSATGATVLQTTGLTSITVDITAGVSTITLASVANWPTGGGMGFLTDSRGTGFNDQFYYTSISGLVLQGVVWLPAAAYAREPGGVAFTAGGIAHTQAQETAIQPSGAMVSGDDCRAWINDVEVERYLVAWGTATSDVVVNVDMPAAKYLTIRDAMTSALPAVGSVLYFNESVGPLAPSGFLAIDNEIVHYSAKYGTNGVILDGTTRAHWGTTAATHTAATKAYANPMRFVVAVGYAKAGAAPQPFGRRPAIQLAGSSNQVYKWGDVSNDASTVLFDRNYPDRPMSWAPGFDADGNTVSPLMSISASAGALTFKDDVPGDGSAPANFAEVFIPQGLDAGLTTAINMDWTPSAEILNLELFTRDAQGVTKLIDQLQQAAAAANRNLSSSAGAAAGFGVNQYVVKLKGRYNISTGYRGEDATIRETITNGTNSVTADGVVAFGFTISSDRPLSGFTARLAKATAGAQNVSLQIYGDTGGAPDTASGALVGFGAVSVSGTTPTFYHWKIGPRALTKPGNYWAIFFLPDTFATVNFYGSPSQTTISDRTRDTIRTAGAWQAQAMEDLWCYVLVGYDNEGAALLEADQPVLTPGASGVTTRSAVTASFDDPEFTLEPTQSVYVHRLTAFVSGVTAGTLYHLIGTLTNPSTGDTITLDKWMILASSLEIDCDEKTITHTENGIAYQIMAAASFSNPSQWFPLTPGANAATFSDAALVTASAGRLDLTAEWRARKT